MSFRVKVISIILTCICIISGISIYYALMLQNTTVACYDTKISKISNQSEEIDLALLGNYTQFKKVDIDYNNLKNNGEPHYKKILHSVSISKHDTHRNILTYAFTVNVNDTIMVLEYIIFLNILIFTFVFNINKIIKERWQMAKNEKKTTYILSLKCLATILVCTLLIILAHVLLKISWEFYLSKSFTIFIISLFILLIGLVYSFYNREKTYELHCIICDIEEIRNVKNFDDHIRLLVRDLQGGAFYVLFCPYIDSYKKNEYVYFDYLVSSNMEGIDYEIAH